MSARLCPVCQTTLQRGIYTWHLTCSGCHYEGSTLEPVINSSPAHELIDESKREAGLKTLRTRNFQTVLSRINALKKQGSRLLEVGCAHGWFLDLARQDFDVTGIEPDQQLLERLDKRLPVRHGYFPQALEEGETFDVIVFNDVIEHIPDIKMTLDTCRRHMNEGGLLVLNLPNSNGIFYRQAKWLAQHSMQGPFNRLWQKDLPSPHVHYFNPTNLERLLGMQGFTLMERGRLPTLVLKGLHARIALVKGLGPLTQQAAYVALLLALPMLRLLPGDIFYCLAQRQPD